MIEQIKNLLTPSTNEKPGNSLASGAIRVGREFEWPFRKGEAERLLRKLERHKTAFLQALYSSSAYLLTSINHILTSAYRSLAIEDHDNAISKSFDVPYRLTKVGERQCEILNWLSNEDFAGKHESIRKQRTVDTGAWFLTSREFQEWCTEELESSSVLLCLGDRKS